MWNLVFIFQDTVPVNVADTLTAGMVADIRKELHTMLRSYDWGADILELAIEKEAVRKVKAEMKQKEIMESKLAQAKRDKPNGDLQKNLADDSIFIRIIGISVVIFLLAVVVYSIFGEFELWSSEPPPKVGTTDPGIHELWYIL